MRRPSPTRHAWQSLANGRLYVTNIRDGLIAVDPEGKSFYEANTPKYLDEIVKEESDVKAALAADGPAPSYLDMFGHNVGALTAALSS